MNVDIYSKIFNKIVAIMLLILFLYSSLFIISAAFNINKKINKHNYLSVKLYKNLSLTKKCDIFECTAIRKSHKITHYANSIPLLVIDTYSKNIQVYDNIYYDTTQLSFNYKTNNIYVYFDINSEYQKNLFSILITLPFIILILIYIIASTIRQEQEESLVTLAGNEALLANKTMINITENIHHELNTPLEVIDNKVEKIRRLLTKVATELKSNIPEGQKDIRDLGELNFEKDFEFIKTSGEQIYAVLEKMKGFKHLRYSNGNKTIKDIIDGSFKIISISNTNFTYKLDDKLTEFKLNSKVIKNADLLSIMLNHIKNSLEANASKVYICVETAKDKFIYVRIIDNGLGIPKDAKRDIFKPNFSTKPDLDNIRGNGMYLNKHILESTGGAISLIESSNQGTTIELKIPSIKII